MYLLSLMSVLCWAMTSSNVINNSSIFSASVFIFFDELKLLSLNNEITTLKWWCSGCIIGPRWVVTTALCFHSKPKEPPNPEHYIVVPTKGLTTFKNSKDLKSYEVQKINLDKDWGCAEYGMTVALLMLKHDFYFTYIINKAKIASTGIKTGKDCMGLLWKRQPLQAKGITLKPYNLSSHLNIRCKEKRHQHEFCSGYKVDADSCYDISGSILMCNNKLQGIGSSQYGGGSSICVDETNTSYINVLYTDIGMYDQWINSQIDKTMFELKQNESNAEWLLYNGGHEERFSMLLNILVLICFVNCNYI